MRKKFSHYSAEFKLSVLQRMWSEQLSYTQTATLYDIRGDRSIVNWERQYHGGGIDALKPRRRGRPRKMPTRPAPPGPPAPDGTDPRPREELLKEIEDLRAEVAYLKKLDALIRAGKRQTQPRKRK
ncbi:hypothetical protein CI15_19440 [Paraburkholderia monticola]|uniref:Insertion element IS150 protein InsJ-like helix-turn-helix domain-containing protein n=1 Tax=Paraburkholderia monticola TaxID=1399968 RepID=A0A149PL75_9BURK|nr:hypothetical protein CI15_19440 [Paraburkholderia monticola]